MLDPLSLASTAIGLLKSTTEALNALRERSQRSKDIDIKDQINTLYDNVLQLKEVAEAEQVEDTFEGVKIGQMSFIFVFIVQAQKFLFA